VLLLEDLLELERNHALEGDHFNLGQDAFSGEEIAEVTASMGVLRCFCFHRLDRINFWIPSWLPMKKKTSSAGDAVKTNASLSSRPTRHS
jgi:hypothetical protein